MVSENSRIRRAVLSCHNKAGLVDFARVLAGFDVELITTEGTHRVLDEAGIESKEIAEFTGVREMLSGRVKSLHPRVHAGVLAIRENKVHVEEMQTYGYQWIDLVVVNLHPIAALIQQTATTPDEVIEQVDIGGLAMIRSAAKNFRYVTVVVNPERYPSIVHEMRAHDGTVTYRTRFALAQEAFATTAAYDKMLAEFLQRSEPPEE